MNSRLWKSGSLIVCLLAAALFAVSWMVWYVGWTELKLKQHDVRIAELAFKIEAQLEILNMHEERLDRISTAPIGLVLVPPPKR